VCEKAFGAACGVCNESRQVRCCSRCDDVHDDKCLLVLLIPKEGALHFDLICSTPCWTGALMHHLFVYIQLSP
jgi:hypothetical protein